MKDTYCCSGVLKTLKIFKKYYFLVDKMQNIWYNISVEKEVIILVFNIKTAGKAS